MHDIELHFRVRDITDYTNYYLGNEWVLVENNIHVSSNNYVNKIMYKYQKTHGDLKKEVLPIRVKEHPDMDDFAPLNEKYHKDFQHIIGLCQWLIVADRFDLEYSFS